MEKGKCGFWYYGPHASPALIKALGDNIQAVNNPRVGPEPLHAGQSGRPADDDVVQGEGRGVGVHQVHRVGRRAAAVHRQAHGAAGAQVVLQQSRRSRTTGSSRCRWRTSNTWYMPPYYQKNWANFQDKIPPYWQETLSKKITVQQFHEQGAKFLRGQA